jgi:cardiolipin synthase A/B
LEPLIASLTLAGHPVLFGILHSCAAIGVTIHTLLHKRDVPAAIAWIGMAWFAPIVGALLYVGFGINRVKRRARALKGSGGESEGIPTGDESSAEPIERLKVAVGQITGQAIADCEVVAILDSGDRGYPQMLSAIEGAKVRVSLCTFIFRNDELGAQFIASLVRAHLRGVKVRVLIDGFGGGFLLSPAYHRLRGQGVPAALFLHSLLPWKMPFLDLRMHKKCLVVDGVTAFVGGLNIGAENLVATHPNSGVRDCHFCLAGTIVAQIEQQFDDDWVFTTGEAPTLPDAPLLAASEERSPARTIVTGPDQNSERLVFVLMSAVNSARKSIRIVTPYFLPDEQLVIALQLASLRGVAVQLVLPEKNNHMIMGWALQAHVRPLLASGCNIWRSPLPFDHTKLMTIDDEWSLIGSANWDTRSLRLNFEMTVEVYDRDFALKLGQHVDTRCIRRTNLAEIDQRSLPIKLRDAAARLAMPYI